MPHTSSVTDCCNLLAGLMLVPFYWQTKCCKTTECCYLENLDYLGLLFLLVALDVFSCYLRKRCLEKVLGWYIWGKRSLTFFCRCRTHMYSMSEGTGKYMKYFLISFKHEFNQEIPVWRKYHFLSTIDLWYDILWRMDSIHRLWLMAVFISSSSTDPPVESRHWWWWWWWWMTLLRLLMMNLVELSGFGRDGEVDQQHEEAGHRTAIFKNNTTNLQSRNTRVALMHLMVRWDQLIWIAAHMCDVRHENLIWLA